MHIEEIVQKIVPGNAECAKLAQARFDALIKPVGSLAQLERMTAKYAGIVEKYNKLEIEYPKRELLVWCGIAEAETATKIMEAKMPVNVLAAETGARTQALLVTAESVEEALEEGATLVQEIVHEKGLGLLGFGCLAAAEDNMVIAAMTGGILQAASMRVGIMLDGIAALKAAQKAAELAPAVLDYCFAGHVSTEEGVESCSRSSIWRHPCASIFPTEQARAQPCASPFWTAASRPTRKWKPLRRPASMRR